MTPPVVINVTKKNYKYIRVYSDEIVKQALKVVQLAQINTIVFCGVHTTITPSAIRIMYP